MFKFEPYCLYSLVITELREIHEVQGFVGSTSRFTFGTVQWSYTQAQVYAEALF